MTRLLRATWQLIPSALSVLAYATLSTLLLLFVTGGLKATGEHSGALWGMRLVHFGFTSEEILSNAYLEMMHHVWTLIALPFMCFIGLKPACRSFRSDFVQFLRFSRSSRLFTELARLGALLAVITAVSLPFAAAALWGRFHPGLSWCEALTGFVSCGGTILFVAAVTYLLASCGAPTEIAIGIGMAIPFFLTGLSMFFEKVNHVFLHNHMPPGLPYMVDSYTDSNIRIAVAIAALGLTIRVLMVGRTQRLTG